MAVTIRADALVTLDEAKGYCKVKIAEDYDDYDDMLTLLINFVTEYILGEVGRPFSQSEKTELYYLDTGRVLLLKQWPVVSITSLTIDGDEISSDDYMLDKENGILVFDAEFAKRCEVKVVYKGGINGVPDDIKICALYLIRRMFDKWAKNLESVASFSGGGSITVKDEVDDIVKRCIEKYKSR